MKLVAGLGNPGRAYEGTRHNVGFDVLDSLAARHRLVFSASRASAVEARWRVGDDVALLVKPLTFMNLSGEAVSALCRFYKIEVADVLVVCDEVNLPVGRLRIRGSGSEGGHNGLRSVAAHLGSTEYARLRIGVGRGDARRNLADHVLAGFDAEEQTGIADVVARSADAVELWITQGLGPAMNTFNRVQ